ncbi:hypothetical protein N0V95_005921 [Ascochyta clinopodiicola]|nr:hypothetical protein N0V95_005921 [Ascochyta clinopodiicola]
MNTSQLAQELDALRRNFAQYRVEMAIQVDSLERRLSTAESALAGLGDPKAISHFPPLRSAPPASAPGPGHSSTMPRFTERRHRMHAPPPISIAPAPSSQIRTPAYESPTYVHHQHLYRKELNPTKTTASHENAAFLPFVLEKIAASSQKKSQGDNRTCACGRPTFDVKCFRDHHFGWCLSHQRPIMHGLQSCGGRNRGDCRLIHWEKHANWELLVKTSFDGGHLGTKEVKNLYEILFPEEIYPEKYQSGWFMG